MSTALQLLLALPFKVCEETHVPLIPIPFVHFLPGILL